MVKRIEVTITSEKKKNIYKPTLMEYMKDLDDIRNTSVVK